MTVAMSPSTLFSDLPSLTADLKALVMERATPSASVEMRVSWLETPPSSVEKLSGNSECSHLCSSSGKAAISRSIA